SACLSHPPSPTDTSPLPLHDALPIFDHLALLIEMGDAPAGAELEDDDDSVSLLTAHGAKGLEFPVVFMVDLIEQRFPTRRRSERSEEHTSELQSLTNLVCRLLLEKKT